MGDDISEPPATREPNRQRGHRLLDLPSHHSAAEHVVDNPYRLLLDLEAKQPGEAGVSKPVGDSNRPESAARLAGPFAGARLR